LQILDISFNSITGLGKIEQIPELQTVEKARERQALEAAILEAKGSK
jgi:hypothetical protein